MTDNLSKATTRCGANFQVNCKVYDLGKTKLQYEGWVEVDMHRRKAKWNQMGRLKYLEKNYGSQPSPDEELNYSLVLIEEVKNESSPRDEVATANNNF